MLKIKNLAKKLTIAHNSKTLNSLNGDAPKTWKFVNALAGNPKNSVDDQIEVSHNDLKYQGKDVPEFFSQHFSEIGEKISSNLPPSNSSFKDFLPDNSTFSTFSEFPAPNKETISDIIKSIQSKTSKDIDNLSMKIIKRLSNALVDPLTHFFQEIVHKGKIPKFLKRAKVIVLHKKGPKEDMNNYRPISLLPIFSKILEKFLNQHLNEHFSSIISNNQFGFSTNIGCIDALGEMFDKIRDKRANNLLVGGTFCDITKAFDCVSPDILLKKMSHYGISDKALDLMSDYLSDRSITVFCNGHTSKEIDIKLGVPQGSVMGPTLFLIYINDLISAISSVGSEAILFADDSTILSYGKNETDLEQNMQAAINMAQEWFLANRLSLHPDKTRSIIFLGNSECSPILNGKKIKLIGDKDEPTYRLLGINIDKKLTFDYHTQIVCNKLKSYLFALRRMRPHINKSARKNFFHAFIQSTSTYCASTWLHKKSNLHKINVLYKKGIRLISDKNKLHTIPICISEKILPLESFLTQQVCTQSHKNLKNEKISFAKTPRLREKLIAIQPSTLSSLSILSNQVHAWNHLPFHLRDIPQLLLFKKELKNIYYFP